MDKNLKAFLAVARHQSLTAACGELALTQPSVTKRIANLEHQVGADLFDRDRRGMKLTAAGKVFFRRAERIEDEYRQCLEEVSTITTAGMPVLRVGAGPVFHLNCVARLFAALIKQFPALKLEVKTDTGHDIAQPLSAGELDIYLGIIPKEQVDEAILVKYITSVEHGIVVRSDDPNAQNAVIDPSKLKGYRWVSFVVDPETERRIQEYCAPEGAVESMIDIRTTSFATGLQLVKEGGFVMSAPLQLANRIESEGLRIRPTVHGMPRRDAGVYVRKSSLGYNAIQAVLSYFETEDLDF
ncbi:MAG: LysR family transcriptional regulator [Roseibium sp.]|uniref:LysR family transcriptional regulator n=1 Tax=Roseibium sp. TaxID=1936156 RepID=UPI002636592D|nr:LysR family transcriptional regulator [Roseibium sp.]MCV0427439.1 LysR family transcriptional regulator [Roseibium sp.]